MGDLVKFVDAIDSAANVRLDLNDEVKWATVNFDAPPPSLKRAISSNLVSPGGYVAHTAHDLRTVTISLELITTNQDGNATELQKLARELDRPRNILMFQPTGMSNPVFFKTYRSPVTKILDMVGAKAYRTLTIEVLADPYALGELETVFDEATINNDPEAATNPMHLAVPTIFGDVPAPLRVEIHCTGLASAMQRNQLLGITTMQPGQAMSPRPFFFQAEDATASTDTSVTADTSMSGDSKMRTTPGTASSVTRWFIDLPGEQPGEYRVFVRCAKSVSTDVWDVQVAQNYGGGNVGPGVRHQFDANTTTPMWVDCGVIALGLGNANVEDTTLLVDANLQFIAGRTSGTGSLDSDCVLFIPVSAARILDSRICIADLGGVASGSRVVWDTENDKVYSYVISSGRLESRVGNPTTGSLPWVYPDHTQYLWYMLQATHYTTRNAIGPFVAGDPGVDLSVTVSAYYYPRFLYVRPLNT